MPHQDVDPRNRHLGKVMRQRLTPAEFALWRRLRNRGLADLRFRRQAPLGPYIVDFFCPERKLAVELDGSQHGFHQARANDSERDAWLIAHGVRVLRFRNRDVISNLDGVCQAIIAAALPAPES